MLPSSSARRSSIALLSRVNTSFVRRPMSFLASFGIEPSELWTEAIGAFRPSTEVLASSRASIVFAAAISARPRSSSSSRMRVASVGSMVGRV